MTRTIRTFVALGAMVFALAWSESRASADASAQSFIQSRQSEITALLRQAASAQRDRKVSTILEVMIDFDELAKRSLAAHWADLSEGQRKEFTDVLRRLVQRSYERNIKNILGYNVEYLGEEPVDGDGNGVIVHTKASSKTDEREEPVTIDYRMAPSGDRWRVVDIVTLGASMVNNYKNQFHRVIQKDGVDALLKRMKDKLAKGQNV